MNSILSLLSERERNILSDRYGLWDGIAETLQDVGDKLGLTRERIRQIEAKGIKRIRRLHGHGTIRQFISRQIRSYAASNEEGSCGVLSEEEVLGILADGYTIEEASLAVEFLQDIDSLGEELIARSLFEIEPGVYSFTRKDSSDYQEVLRLIELSLQRSEKPLTENALFEKVRSLVGHDLGLSQIQIASRILSISPRISFLSNGTVALSEWKEFQKHDAASLAESTLRLLGRPAHFREITEKIPNLFEGAGMLQGSTVHNALITKRKKFVRIKTGTYGLVAWGLKTPPFIKDRLVELLSEAQYPLPYWHLQEKVLEVCNCKSDSIRMILDMNPRLFMKFGGEQYGLRKHFEK